MGESGTKLLHGREREREGELVGRKGSMESSAPGTYTSVVGKKEKELERKGLLEKGDDKAIARGLTSQ